MKVTVAILENAVEMEEREEILTADIGLGREEELGAPVPNKLPSFSIRTKGFGTASWTWKYLPTAIYTEAKGFYEAASGQDIEAESFYEAFGTCDNGWRNGVKTLGKSSIWAERRTIMQQLLDVGRNF